MSIYLPPLLLSKTQQTFQPLLSYIERWGAIEGKGVGLAAGLRVRATDGLVFYGEAGIDASTVPVSMNESGMLFSYAARLAGGVRVAFGL